MPIVTNKTLTNCIHGDHSVGRQWSIGKYQSSSNFEVRTVYNADITPQAFPWLISECPSVFWWVGTWKAFEWKRQDRQPGEWSWSTPLTLFQTPIGGEVIKQWEGKSERIKFTSSIKFVGESICTGSEEETFSCWIRALSVSVHPGRFSPSSGATQGQKGRCCLIGLNSQSLRCNDGTGLFPNHQSAVSLCNMWNKINSSRPNMNE